MKITYKISSAIATGVLMSSLLAPTAFADTITVSDNGPFSNNSVNVTNNQSTNITQSNTSIVTTTVNSTADTGHNSASFNNGGSVDVTSGNATSNVTVTVTGNGNMASTPPCGCLSLLGGNDLTVSGNSAFSKNSIKVTNKHHSSTTQVNTLVVGTGVNSKAKTGKNSASFNNGGTTSVTSKDAKSDVNVSVDGGTNVLNPSI